MIILMHEPTDELFLGVMHPDAALFSDYFDIELAAKEHAARQGIDAGRDIHPRQRKAL